VSAATLLRDYRRGRREYGLPANAAVAYARDKRTLSEADELLFGFELDYTHGEEPAVSVLVTDLDGFILASVGGVDVHHQVSDHGNLNLDDDDPYLVTLTAQLVRECEAGHSVATGFAGWPADAVLPPGFEEWFA
jgi:hypothetical protein